MNINELLLTSFMDSYKIILCANVISGQCLVLKDELTDLATDSHISLNDFVENSLPKLVEFRNIGMVSKLLLSLNSISAAKAFKGTAHPFRTHINDTFVWHKLSFAIPNTLSEKSPEILLCISQVNQSESNYYDLQHSIDDSFFAVHRVNLNTGNLLAFPTKLLATMEHPSFVGTDFLEWKKFMVKHFVNPDDTKIFNRYMDTKYLSDYFKYNRQRLPLYYRRRIGNVFLWVKCLIIPSYDYSEENPEVYFLTIDCNVDSLRYLALVGQYQYQSMESRRANNISEAFYNDILNLLSILTADYQVFLSVDLKRDTYLSYKAMNTFHDPYSLDKESFSTVLKKYSIARFPEETREQILSFLSIDNLREQLTNKSMIELHFTFPGGQPMKCVVTKTRVVDGIPTQVTVAVFTDTENDALLKIKTFGAFEAYGKDGQPIHFEKKASKEVLAYLVDKKGYPVKINDIIIDVLEKSPEDLNAKKYASGLLRKAVKNLTEAGYPTAIEISNHAYSINMNMVDCDYYHLLNGNVSYWQYYHNEYMTQYSWAEETNAEILHYFEM